MGWQERGENRSQPGEDSAFLKKILLFWHTLRFLKFRQIYGRLYFRFFKPKKVASPVCKARSLMASAVPFPLKPCKFPEPDAFSFLNLRKEFSEVGWEGRGMEKLWRYHLHYFDYLLAENSQNQRQRKIFLMEDWISKNPPFDGIGWDSYPTSLRIVNWIKWTLLDNRIEADLLAGLALQTEWLSKRLEFHLCGNHLIANAKALIFAGLFFEGRDADKWLKLGVGILRKELNEQILEDGGHFERSTMYHGIVLEDLLDLINLLKGREMESSLLSELGDELLKKARQMANWYHAMMQPDGRLCFFNDCSIELGTDPGSLLEYARELGCEIPAFENQTREFPASGYLRLSNPESTALAWLDVGAIGADYVPGHAHADSLSFEFSLFGNRLVVNGGCSTYEANEQRLLERSTRSHSALELGGLDSSEVWSSFRVARRAKPLNKRCKLSESVKTVSCSHDGYVSRLRGKPVHQRRWELSENQFLIADEVICQCRHPGIARFIFHTEIEAVPTASANQWLLTRESRELATVEVIRGKGMLRRIPYASGFGRLDETCVLEVSLDGFHAETKFFWEK